MRSMAYLLSKICNTNVAMFFAIATAPQVTKRRRTIQQKDDDERILLGGEEFFLANVLNRN